jgi:hypothetical protein
MDETFDVYQAVEKKHITGITVEEATDEATLSRVCPHKFCFLHDHEPFWQGTRISAMNYDRFFSVLSKDDGRLLEKCGLSTTWCLLIPFKSPPSSGFRAI